MHLAQLPCLPAALLMLLLLLLLLCHSLLSCTCRAADVFAPTACRCLMWRRWWSAPTAPHRRCRCGSKALGLPCMQLMLDGLLCCSSGRSYQLMLPEPCRVECSHSLEGSNR